MQDDDDSAAAQPNPLCPADAAEVSRPDFWQVNSHCKGIDADYSYLFDDTQVRRIDIRMDSATHDAMTADLTSILGTFGSGTQGGPPSGSGDPAWFAVELDYDGNTWTQVGMRYKGNSSLRSSWQGGYLKLSFRLHFDKFADDDPSLVNQRFWGFKKMTFSNGFVDPSLIRDKTAADLFRDAGVPAAFGTFVRVFVDWGDGPVYFGLYTMIEDPADDMLTNQFGDDTGNLYKPESSSGPRGSSGGLQNFDASVMVKKTNETAADYSDVQAFIAALNASNTDAATWRANLEATIDVGGFLQVLAMNQAMVNWDSYGWMHHNYYIYGDPLDGGRLVWFPWDLNEALMDRSQGGNGGPPGGGPWATATSVMLDEIGSEWPMIRRLLDDPVYRADYQARLQAVLSGPFAAPAVKARMQANHDLIAPYVVGAEGESAPYTFLVSDAAFNSSLQGGTYALFAHVDQRHSDVAAALGL